jgi:chromosome segregation ATPase
MPMPPPSPSARSRPGLKATASLRLAVNKQKKPGLSSYVNPKSPTKTKGTYRSATEQAAKYKGLLAESRAKNVQLVRENEQFAARFEDLRGHLLKADDSARQDHQTIAICNEKIEHLRHELSQASLTEFNLRSKLSVAADEALESAGKLAACQGQLRDTQGDLAATQTKLAERVDDIGTLTSNLNEAQLRIDALEHHLQSANELVLKAHEHERAQSAEFSLKVQQAERAKLEGTEAILQTEKTRDELHARCMAIEESSKSLVEHYQIRATRTDERVQELQQLVAELKIKISEKYSRLEVLDKSISANVKTLLDNLHESAAAEGYTQDALKWKLVRSQVDILREHMQDVFDTMNIKMLEKDTRIEALTQVRWTRVRHFFLHFTYLLSFLITTYTDCTSRLVCTAIHLMITYPRDKAVLV